MLFDTKTIGESVIAATVSPRTADTGKIRLGGACRLPVKAIGSQPIRDLADHRAVHIKRPLR